MEENKKTILPKGFKIFFAITVFMNTLPMLVVSIMKLFNIGISEKFTYVISIISKSSGTLLLRDNFPVVFSLVLGILILFAYYRLITDSFNLKRFQKKIWLDLLRLGEFFAILNTILLFFKLFKNPEYITGWNFVANAILLLIYHSAFLFYLYSKEAKNFFLKNNEEITGTKNNPGPFAYFVVIILLVTFIGAILPSINPFSKMNTESRKAEKRSEDRYKKIVNIINDESLKGLVLKDIIFNRENRAQTIFVLENGFKIEPIDITYGQLDPRSSFDNMNKEQFDKYIEQKNVKYNNFLQNLREELINKVITFKADSDISYYDTDQNDTYFVHAYLGDKLIDINFVGH